MSNGFTVTLSQFSQAFFEAFAFSEAVVFGVPQTVQEALLVPMLKTRFPGRTYGPDNHACTRRC